MAKVDKEAKRNMLHAQLDSVLPHLLPHGKFNGHYFEAGSIYGEDGKSLKVYRTGKNKGMWADYAEKGKHKDIFALWMEARNISFREMMAEVDSFLGLTEYKPSPKATQKAEPEPSGTPIITKYRYHDADGNLHMTVTRKDYGPKNKRFSFYDEKAKKPEAPAIRVLYCLPSVIEADQVIIAEGEKSADALRRKGYVATTASGGSNNPLEKTDWTPLLGKQVIIWPDADEKGAEYGQRLGQYLLKVGVRDLQLITPPQGKDAGWDAADAFDEDLDFETLIKNKNIVERESRLKTFRGGEILSCNKQPPAELISGGLLAPGSVMLVAGPPKSMKSYLVQWMVANAAIGQGFLGFNVERPLRTFILQAEMDYWLIRKRLQKMTFLQGHERLLDQNLSISDRFTDIMNDEVMEDLIDIIRYDFPHQPPDVIVLDPFANMFDGDNENDNAQVIAFYKKRVEVIRQRINPKAAVINIHHSNKINRQALMEDPFNAIRGGSAHRGYYTTGIFISKIEEDLEDRRVFFDCRSGPAPLPLTLNFDDSTGGFRNVTAHTRIVGQKQGARHDAERRRKKDIILDLIYKEARKGNVFLPTNFAKKYDGKKAMGSRNTIKDRIEVLETQGYIKYFQDCEKYGIESRRGSKNGYMCVEEMMFKTPTGAVDRQTGQPLDKIMRVYPTHFKSQTNDELTEVENRYVWVLRDPDLEVEDNEE